MPKLVDILVNLSICKLSLVTYGSYTRAGGHVSLCVKVTWGLAIMSNYMFKVHEGW